MRVKRPPGRVNDGGATVLFARGPDDANCMLDQYDPATVENWEDVGIEAVAEPSIAGLVAKRYDDIWGGGAIGVSAYTVHAPAVQYSLLCTAPIASDDRRRSIATSLEPLPPGDPAWRPHAAGPRILVGPHVTEPRSIRRSHTPGARILVVPHAATRFWSEVRVGPVRQVRTPHR